MRVAVVGAGAAGLTAAKALLEVGLEPEVFERTQSAGGLWVLQPLGEGPAYRSLRTNTSTAVTAYSDFPFPPGLPYFPGRAAVEAYLHDYARTFGLTSAIRFGCPVSEVRPAGKGYRLRMGAGPGAAEEEYDAVVMAGGIFRRPVMPTYSGLDRFRGQTLHSYTYRTPEPFVGKRVLVVGLGSSAVDIVSDLAPVAANVALNTRRGAWITPRLVNGRPLDHRGSRLLGMAPDRAAARRRRELVVGEIVRRGWPLPSQVWAAAGVPFDPATASGVGSETLLPLLASGAVHAYPGIHSFTPDAVRLVDGRRLEIDTVIFCTGYDLDFPALAPQLRPWTPGGQGLYRLIVAPSRPTLGFIGVCRAQGPIFPIVEMQARWLVQVLLRAVRLPSPAVMEAEIQWRLARQAARRDHPLRVALLPYLDELGADFGARPDLSRYPTLLPDLLAGPPTAAQYRLQGPASWPGAADAIRLAGRPAASE